MKTFVRLLVFTVLALIVGSTAPTAQAQDDTTHVFLPLVTLNERSVPTDPPPMTLSTCQERFGSAGRITQPYSSGTVFEVILANYLGIRSTEIGSLSDDVLEMFRFNFEHFWDSPLIRSTTGSSPICYFNPNDLNHVSVWERPGAYQVGDQPIDEDDIKLVFDNSTERQNFMESIDNSSVVAADAQQADVYTLARLIGDAVAEFGDEVGTLFRNGQATNVKVIKVNPGATILGVAAIDVLRITWVQYWFAENDVFHFVLENGVVYNPFTKTAMDQHVWVYATNNVYVMASSNQLMAGFNYVASIFLNGQGPGETAGLVITNTQLDLVGGNYQASAPVFTELGAAVHGSLHFRQETEEAVATLDDIDLDKIFDAIENLGDNLEDPDPDPYEDDPPVAPFPSPDEAEQEYCTDPVQGSEMAAEVSGLFSIQAHDFVSLSNANREDQELLRSEIDFLTSNMDQAADNLTYGDAPPETAVYYEDLYSVSDPLIPPPVRIGWRVGSHAMVRDRSEIQMLLVCRYDPFAEKADWIARPMLITTIFGGSFQDGNRVSASIPIVSVQLNVYIDENNNEIPDDEWVQYNLVPNIPNPGEHDWGVVDRYAYDKDGVVYAGNGVGDD